MRKIRNVLRYRHSAGLSLEAIARALKISKGVVAKYLRLASAVGAVSYTHLRAHETKANLVCRLLL